MPRKSLPVILCESEITRVEQWLRAGSTPQQTVLRARIILHAVRGWTDQQIALELKIQRRTAALWRGRVREQGIGCAGGIGGLLARTDHSLLLAPSSGLSPHAYYFCDGNGNVTLQAAAQIAA